MCGIIISSLDIPVNSYDYIKNRGPDCTSVISYNNLTFIHFLLHLMGEQTPQPIINNNVVYIFNGEIYNYKEINSNYASDIYAIIDMYQQHGKDFHKKLNGEYAICIFDFNINRLFMCSDVFKTRPLFYHVSTDNITICSYESSCKKIKNQKYTQLEPNQILVFDLISRILVESYVNYNFNLLQYKTNYDDYCTVLEKAILCRYPEKTIPLICLSSGHDSAVIACCLHKYNREFIAISISKNEDLNVINKRKELLGDKHIVIPDIPNKQVWKQYLENNCEHFTWDWTYHPKMRGCISQGFNMGSMLGKCEIISMIQRLNPETNVCYSGIGADEIMALNSFYSQGYGNVDYFPDNLQTVFPWANFFKGSMENYIKGDDYVGGSFSYETRYPFCDQLLVQEFFNLAPILKNNFDGSSYKPALTYYLKRENFPYQLKKYGFNV